MKAPIIGFKCATYPNGSVTQWFGENPGLYKELGLNAHNGIDVVAPWGTPIFCVDGGVVAEVKNDAGGYGMHVRIVNHDREWTYGHLSAINVSVGEGIEEGRCIGNMGNTGFVVSGQTPFWKYNPYAGTHLHLGLRLIDDSSPWKVNYNNGMIVVGIKDYDNGYKGAVSFKLEDDDTTENVTQYLTLISLYNKIIQIIK